MKRFFISYDTAVSAAGVILVGPDDASTSIPDPLLVVTAAQAFIFVVTAAGLGRFQPVFPMDTPYTSS